MVTPEQALEAYKKHGSKRKASQKLGVPRTTFRRLLKKAINQDEAYEDKDLKLRQQEKTINSLKKELKKAQDEKLTNEEVRKYILGIKKQGDSLPDWVVEQRQEKQQDNVPMMLLADLHWGEVIKPQQVFGLNEYNLEIAQQRLKKVTSNAIWLLRNHIQQKSYPGFILALNGDMISGDIHDELSQTNQKAVMPILLDLYGNLKRTIEIFADEFGKVFLPCTIGNHGRTNKKPQHKEQAFKNFDWIVYHLLADWFSNDDRVTFLIGDDDEIQYEVAGHVYRQTHGAQFRGGTGFIGAIAPISRGEHKKRIAAQSQGLVYDTLVLSHFHQTVWRPRVVVCGSLVGYSEYGADLSFEYEPPQMIMWLTDPVCGKNSPMEVWAIDPKEEKEQYFTQVSF
jgi:hypothetical protein